MRRCFACSAALVLSVSVAHAGASPGAVQPSVDADIDPFLRLEVPPGLPGAPAMREDRPLRATLTAPGLEPAARRQLEADGLTFQRTHRGRLAEVGGQWLVEGTLPVLRRAARAGWLLRVGRPMDPRMAPTMVTGAEIGSDALIASGPTPLTGLNGEGVAILDIDSDADPFHPHLFRADGGAWPWVDVDGDGQLSPGIDGLDLDGDGAVADDEVLRLLESWYAQWDYSTGEREFIGLDGALDPDADWLWLDTDGDGERNFGGAAGFTEEDPAYGEPIFAPDDANLDGEIEPAERLLRLDSSRLRVAFAAGEAWRRGTDLVDYPVQPSQALHGTGVLGIMAGGLSRHASRFPGLLPEVELLLWAYRTTADADMIAAIAEAEDEGVQVVLHEYTTWIRYPLDGSDPTELAIDAQAAGGIVHVCPAGNLGGAGKHAQANPAAGIVDFALVVPPSEAWRAYQLFEIGLLAREPLLGCTLTSPSGEELPVVFDGPGPDFADGLVTWSSSWRSPRGTWVHQVYGYPPEYSEQTLSPGRWALRCDAYGSGEVHAYVRDNATSWGRGIYLEDESDASTICWPATSDSCITVGASAGRVEYWSDDEPGQLKDYSSRGPRFFDGRTIDIVAPTDPYAPTPYDPDSEWDPWPGQYIAFGGTSGAGPHVAAVAAQLKQAYPEATGLEVREMIRQGALVDSIAEADGVDALPDDNWGYGKLRAHESLTGGPASAPPSAPVAVTVEFSSTTHPDGCQVTARPSAAGHPDAQFRWDWSYDGRWDGDFVPGDLTYVVERGAPLAVRVQAAIGGWWIGDGLGLWTVPDPCVDDAEEEEPGAACSGCTGCAAGGAEGSLALALLAFLALSRIRRRPPLGPRAPRSAA